MDETDNGTLLTDEQLGRAFAEFDARWDRGELDTVTVSNDPETAGRQALAILDTGYRMHGRVPDARAQSHVEQTVRQRVQDINDDSSKWPHGYRIGLKGLYELVVSVNPCPNFYWPDDPVTAEGGPARCPECGRMFWRGMEPREGLTRCSGEPIPPKPGFGVGGTITGDLSRRYLI